MLGSARRRAKLRRRPLIVLADISGSMELYTRILLQFLHGLTQAHARTETFVFGTRLTRITAQLQLRRVDAALEHAAREIRRLRRRYADRRLPARVRAPARPAVLGRGAVVLIISDGWDTGDPARLGDAMRRLARRAHRVVWCNPLLGKAGYAPEVRGMAAALPYVDDFLPVHDLRSLRALAHRLARIPRRKGSVDLHALTPPDARALPTRSLSALATHAVTRPAGRRGPS